jgi:bifunctional non-homologous end joining protein LigD
VRFRPGPKAQWLLIKGRDEAADDERDIAAEHGTSVATGRTMEEIAAGKRARAGRAKPAAKAEGVSRPSSGRSAASKRTRRSAKPSPASAAAKRSPSLSGLSPMFATIGREIPREEGWTFEPKYDGIRVLAEVTRDRVRLVTRNDRDKAAGFPEIVDALRTLAGKTGVPIVLDGEIVALDAGGKPLRFQELQARMHVKDADRIATIAESTPAALVVFDVLVADGERLLDAPWGERRRRLEKLLRNRTSARLHLAETAPNAGEAELARARAQGWEGVIAKRMNARYRPGARADEWRKLKIEFRQEFVIGGWTEPRRSRQHIGALLLGAYDDAGKFRYVGHAGGGFTTSGLESMYRRLARLERKTSPFVERPVTNEPAHWVRPSVVVEVKFNEWTADGRLRQPIFLGVREDKAAREVTVEATSVQRKDA